MTLLVILAFVGAIFFLTYRSMEKAKQLDQPVNLEPDTPVAPVLTQTCGCGRSKTGFCVGLHKLSEEEWATHEDNPAKKKARKPRAKKSAE